MLSMFEYECLTQRNWTGATEEEFSKMNISVIFIEGID